MRILSTIALVLAFASTAFAAGLPGPPNGAALMNEQLVAQCGENYGVYGRLYDHQPTNPDSTDRTYHYGLWESQAGEVRLSDPVAAQVFDNDGAHKDYVLKGGVAEEVPEGLVARYSDPCSLPGIGPRT